MLCGYLGRLFVALALMLMTTQPQIAFAQGGIRIFNQAVYTYSATDGYSPAVNPISGISKRTELVDPRGRIRNCVGGLLPDYRGFTIGLYNPIAGDLSQTEIGSAVNLTKTSYPAHPDQGLAEGVIPNTGNLNPFALTNQDDGTYSFLLDAKRGQLEVGKIYLLVVNPPSSLNYSQRRIKITIVSVEGQKLVYTATSLDGNPISSGNGADSTTQVITVIESGTPTLDLVGLNLNIGMCPAQELQITKSGDHASAEPGDTVVYRVNVRNISDAPMSGFKISDTLPVGFKLILNSVRGDLEGKAIPIITKSAGRNLTFTTDTAMLPAGQTLRLAYGVQLTPDAIRGNGVNSASVEATVNGAGTNNPGIRNLTAGPATFSLRVRQGLLTDTGTLLGRVFWDKNFDGEQQRDEPGIANAVVVLDDGTRITTDINGLFSLANVLSGAHVGVLDMTSLSGYVIAPNRRFRERNSPARLVRLQPGGLVRLNFAVAPVETEIKKP